jgi:CheY-like chemotaxis protein
MGECGAVLVDNRIRILIADDNLVIQKVTLLMLKNLGIIADLAANGQEVLLALEKRPYEVVLMDIQMPVMDGIETTKLIREYWPHGPKIIVISDCDPNIYQKLSYEAGANDFLAKPVTMLELKAAIERNLSDIWDKSLIAQPSAYEILA